eukprot:TRINITY_DN7115_c0_g2_i1.p1 TRINITY_DN7115_c0_g2~~TRINITY_DN7115_c0_g2_i1.p1  ORF type:complete len:120 (-),score=8.91 TRINITY_DN7115_c0_g2_i1:66-425(-)
MDATNHPTIHPTNTSPFHCLCECSLALFAHVMIVVHVVELLLCGLHHPPYLAMIARGDILALTEAEPGILQNHLSLLYQRRRKVDIYRRTKPLRSRMFCIMHAYIEIRTLQGRGYTPFV